MCICNRFCNKHCLKNEISSTSSFGDPSVIISHFNFFPQKSESLCLEIRFSANPRVLRKPSGGHWSSCFTMVNHLVNSGQWYFFYFLYFWLIIKCSFPYKVHAISSTGTTWAKTTWVKIGRDDAFFVEGPCCVSFFMTAAVSLLI